MAEPGEPEKTLLVVAAFSKHPEALDWARQNLEARFGPVGLTSPLFVFNQTAYYAPSMGSDLLKQFLVFHDLVPPDSLADIKLATNGLEKDLADQKRWPEPRPLNLDPGFLSLGKFLLATTKDQSHRIYLQKGIFAEVTLRFQDKAYTTWPWTYADYREEGVLAFLKEARNYLKRRTSSSFAG